MPISYAYTLNLAGITMALLNIWSLGHFAQWGIVGSILKIGWIPFLILSIGWEVLELYLPYEFASEEWSNKISDVVVNCGGFWLGRTLRTSATNTD